MDSRTYNRQLKKEQQLQNPQSSGRTKLFILGLLFFSVWAGCYYMMSSGADCIRTIPDAVVRCSCDFSSDSAWENYRKETKGAWESVVLDTDPCEK